MKFLLLSILLIVSFNVDAQSVIQKYVRVACECAKSQDYAMFADKFKNAGSTEKERLIYSFVEEEYLTTKRCVITQMSKILTTKEKTEPRPNQEEFSKALLEKCPDLGFVDATCKQIE
jgi:hypothetical protein